VPAAASHEMARRRRFPSLARIDRWLVARVPLLFLEIQPTKSFFTGDVATRSLFFLSKMQPTIVKGSKTSNFDF
jgi:hypothetical protein